MLSDKQITELIRGVTIILTKKFGKDIYPLIKDIIQEAWLIFQEKYSKENLQYKQIFALICTIAINLANKGLQKKNNTTSSFEIEELQDVIKDFMEESFLTERDLEKILAALPSNQAWILKLIRQQGDKSRALYDDNLPEIQQRFGNPFSYEAFRQLKSRAIKAFKKILGNNQFCL